MELGSYQRTISVLLCSYAVAYDAFDPYGSINIKWDIVSWTPDGYVAVVTIQNSQIYRPIMSPGWTIGWTWAEKEVIWSMMGAQATDQGDCSKFKGNIPHCCMRNPTIVDLLPGVPNNQRFFDCCKGGVLASSEQDPSPAVSAFQLSVGLSGTSNKTVKPPKNFYLLGPGPGYTCGAATIAPPTVSLSADGRRRTRTMREYESSFLLKFCSRVLLYLILCFPFAVTWTITCSYSPFLATKNPTCCVSLSSFYNPMITPCPSCACGCRDSNNCATNDLKILSIVTPDNTELKQNAPMVQCTQHMCPVRVHWHVKTNYKEYWRVKITVTNFNYWKNYTKWTLAVQHPNLNNLTKVDSFVYKPLNRYRLSNDAGMFYGIKYFNDLLMEAGPNGHVQTELLLKKDKTTFTLDQGWAFPLKIYFNGDECMMPLPDSYPSLPNSAYRNSISSFTLATLLLMVLLA